MSVERVWRAEQLLPGDVTPFGKVIDCVGANDGVHVYVLVEGADPRLLPRSEAVTVTKGA